MPGLSNLSISSLALCQSPAPTDEGGGGAPEWVPEGYDIWIEPRIIDGFPEGRAWVAGTGIVDVDTLLGTDAAFEGYQETAYNANGDGLTADGYTTENGNGIPAMIGELRTRVLAGASVFLQTKNYPTPGGGDAYVLISAGEDGNGYLALESGISTTSELYSNGDLFEQIASGQNVTLDALNRWAVTLTPTRGEFSSNGTTQAADTIGEDDWPTSGPDQIVGGYLLQDNGLKLQAIGVRSVVEDAATLPTLSAPPVGAAANTVAPAVTGTAQVGQTLSCSTGTWTNSPSLGYTWYDDFGRISGETANTLLLSGEREGWAVYCVVSATVDGVTWTTDSRSNSTDPVAPA